jgi:AcrR family transcriptional regulator
VADEPETRTRILDAAKTSLLQVGYAQLSTRVIAETAGVPLSQIHYHFGSKQGLVLELLEQENRRLLGRQAAMFGADMPLWKQWEQACDFLDDDLESGYVRVLQEMAAAGWSDPEIARAVGQDIRGWFDLLVDVARRAEERFGSLGPFRPEEMAALAGLPFLGAETVILLGLDETMIAARSALRRVGDVLRRLDEGQYDMKELGNGAGRRRRR